MCSLLLSKQHRHACAKAVLLHKRAVQPAVLSPLNSVEVWSCSSGGKNASLPAAIVCGSAAGMGHIFYDRLQPVHQFQRWLVDNDLMDKPGTVLLSGPCA